MGVARIELPRTAEALAPLIMMTPATSNTKERAEILRSFGATPPQVKELLSYNENRFDWSGVEPNQTFPLDDEPSVAMWCGYAEEAASRGVYTVLCEKLVQLRFPIRQGMSKTPAYAVATRKGVHPDDVAEATGLELNAPDDLEIVIHPTAAGRIPLLIVHNRNDFVALVQALAMRNEPEPIPDSQGACMVAGLNNWDRIDTYRAAWEEKHPAEAVLGGWQQEFGRILPQKELYQDRLIVLSDGPYSAVPAGALGFPDEEWRRLSLTIRREHECTHYFTRRVLGSMHDNLLDELIADYAGITAAAGRYRADWFLRFMGLDSFPAYREGGRLENYRGDPPLSEGAFRVLQALVRAAAENVEAFCVSHSEDVGDARSHVRMIMAMARLTLEQLASTAAVGTLRDGFAHGGWMDWAG